MCALPWALTAGEGSAVVARKAHRTEDISPQSLQGRRRRLWTAARKARRVEDGGLGLTAAPDLHLGFRLAFPSLFRKNAAL